ncbi:methionine synthase, partial [bacterium]|nr:methionine synthase [bacterium]
MKTINEKIKSLLNDRILILDGAMGTMIQTKGLTEEDFRGKEFIEHDIPLKGNNDILNLTRPDVIIDIHKSFLEAGADIIETNTFNSTSVSQADYKMEKEVYRLNFEGARIAKEAANSYDSPEKPRFVTGILGPTSKTLSMPVKMDDPSFRDLGFDELVLDYSEALRGLIDGGADLIMIETIFDTLNAKAAVYAVKEYEDLNGIKIPLMISGTITDASGRTLTGQTPEAFYCSLAHAAPISIGFNCALGPKQMLPHLEAITSIADCALSTHPNAGLPNEFGEYDETPENIADQVCKFAEKGLINIAGGCCGTTPAHIKVIAEKLKGKTPRKISNPEQFSFFSGLEPFYIKADSLFVNVGERTNVAGSRRFLKLIKKGNYVKAIDIARNQVDNGAQIIDINMDEALLDSVKEMTTFLRILASEPEISRIPFMVDSSKWEVILEALKNIQGKAIVNSISLKEGEEEFIKKATVISRFGAGIVVMAFDEQGQADSYERKVAICKRAYTLLTEKAGIKAEDIIFDPNIFAIGTGISEHDNYAVDYFKASKEIKRMFPGVHVSGGLSNVSFSFRGNTPMREAIHSVFLYHAIKSGMDMGIVNPTQLEVYDEIAPELLERLEDLVLNRREDATERIIEVADRFEGKKKESTATEEWRKTSISKRIEHSLVKGISTWLEADMEESRTEYGKVIDIIEGPLLGGMNKVGELFGAGKMFLPQVVKSARTMKTAVSYILPYLDDSESNDIKKTTAGTILIATVKGDVHDIGKNIVSVVLGCNNYNIIDLGVMISNEKIIDAAIENDADIIGLSGLITPSLEEMSEFAKKMEEKGLTIPVMVGGATTSAIHTALKIAPNYSGVIIHVKDASLAVNVARKLMNKNTRNDYIAEIKSEQEILRNQRSQAYKDITYVDFEKARSLSFKPDFKGYTPARPTFIGHKGIEVEIETLIKYIDWNFFFKAWELKGTYPEILEHPEYGSEAKELIENAEKMLRQLSGSGRLKPKGAVCFYPASSASGVINVFENEKKKKVLCTINTLRQQRYSESKKEYLSLSDFIANGESGIMDYIGGFSVTSGLATNEISDEYKKNNDEYNAIMVKILADRLAEAFAEYLHEYVRTELWGCSKDEKFEAKDLFKLKYKGIRPAPGYPPCPDHTKKQMLFKLLNAKEHTGIKLTESFM